MVVPCHWGILLSRVLLIVGYMVKVGAILKPGRGRDGKIQGHKVGRAARSGQHDDYR
jgi:hypothetical protein